MKKNSIVKGAIFLNLNMVILYVAISLIILLMDFTNLKLFFSTFIAALQLKLGMNQTLDSLSSSVMYLHSFIQFVELGNSWVFPG